MQIINKIIISLQTNYLNVIFLSLFLLILILLFIYIKSFLEFDFLITNKSENLELYYVNSLNLVLSYTIVIYTYTLLVYYQFARDCIFFQQIYTFKITKYFIFTFAIDNLSLLFLLLTAFIIPICILIHYSYNIKESFYYSYNERSNVLNLRLEQSYLFLISMLFLLLLLFIFFTTLDLFIFFIAFEGSIIPIFFLINLYGSRVVNRVKASLYIYFFTVISSISFIFAIFLIFFTNGSTNFLFLSFNQYTEDMQICIWLLFFIPIASKVPIIPLHVWLPEAHVEAPTEGSVLLASLMLKLGVYFILRFLLPLFPAGLKFFMPLSYSLFSVGVLYTSILIFNQIDLKKIIAYSSIAHMNLALLGLFSGTIQGIQGCLFMLFTHGIISSGLFICIGWLYSRYHSRLITNYRGITYYLPTFSGFFFIFVLGNLSFPGTGSFISELLIIIGVFQKSLLLAVVCLISSFLCTIYSILMFTRNFFGTPLNYSLNKISTIYNSHENTEEDQFSDNYKHFIQPQQQLYAIKKNINLVDNMLRSEFYVLCFLVIYTMVSGLFPNIYLNFIKSNAIYYLIILN